jgi:hypothetical protein
MGALALPMMPLLIPVFVWLYTLVFVLASLWFTHYSLAALDAMRRGQAVEVLPPLGSAPSVPALPSGPTAGSDSSPPIALP